VQRYHQTPESKISKACDGIALSLIVVGFQNIGDFSAPKQQLNAIILAVQR
jgi:hypothetical protein